MTVQDWEVRIIQVEGHDAPWADVTHFAKEIISS